MSKLFRVEKVEFPFRKYVMASIVINLLSILGVLAIGKFLPPQIPLFYGLAEGEEQLASSWSLIIPNTLALAITLANILISLSAKDDFIKRALIITSIAATFLATITTVKIAFLVGSF